MRAARRAGTYAAAAATAISYNGRIYSNIVRLVESTGERVLVIYGAGHLGWLQQNFASNPTIRLRKLAEFVR